MIKVSNVDSLLIGDEFLNFNYLKQPIKDSEVSRWREQGYYHKSFTGAYTVVKILCQDGL